MIFSFHLRPANCALALVLGIFVLPLSKASAQKATSVAEYRARSVESTTQIALQIRDPNVRALMQAAIKEDIPNFPVLSHDGKTLIYSGDRHGTRVWRIKSGVPKEVPRAPRRLNFAGAVFSPDGRLLAAPWRSEDRRPGATLFDTHTWKIVCVLPAALANTVSSLAFSHDGKRLLAGDAAGSTVIYDVETGQVLKQWHYQNIYKSLVVGFALTPEGEKAVALTVRGHFYGYGLDEDTKVKQARQEAAQLWDVEANVMLADFPFLTEVGFAAFSPDGLQIAMMGDAKFDLHTMQSSSKILLTSWMFDQQRIIPAHGVFWWTFLLFTPQDTDLIYAGRAAGEPFFHVVPNPLSNPRTP